MSERIHSVATFREALAGDVREYLTHIEPTAPHELLSLRLEVTGPYIGIVMSIVGEKEPSLQISMNGRRDEPVDAPDDVQRKGIFR